jgi:hypothetical protein
MPRNVRNFWIELEVDGKRTRVATGPVRKDGGFTMRVLMREDGDISDKYLDVRGYVEGETIRLDAVAVNETDSTGRDMLLGIETER